MSKVQRVAIKFKKCTYKFKYVLYVMEMLTKAWKSTPKKIQFLLYESCMDLWR